jgi:hypothetical protein
MSNLINETLEDGTEYQFDLDVCEEQATKVLDQLFELENNLEDFDFTATVFNLYINCIHILSSSGWTKEELVNEVANYLNKEEN